MWAHVGKSWVCDTGVLTPGDTKCGGHARACELSIHGSGDCGFDTCCSAIQNMDKLFLGCVRQALVVSLELQGMSKMGLGTAKAFLHP